MIVLLAYFTLLLTTQHVYRASSIGKAHVVELVMSQMLSNFISITVMYVGAALYVHKLFSIVPLFVIFIIQMLIGMVWTILVNAVYYKKHHKARTAIIYKDRTQLEMLLESPSFTEKYEVTKLIEKPAEDFELLRRELEGCEVLFSVEADTKMEAGLAKICVETNLEGYFVPSIGQIVMTGAEYMTHFSLPMLRVRRAGGHSEYRFFKRLFDFSASLIGVLVASPIMLVSRK